MHDKKRVYRRNGVQEYIIWQTFENKLDWFSLQSGEYVLLPDNNGVVRSQVYPGLGLAVPAILAGNIAKAITVLQLGLASPEHTQFIKL